MSLHLTTVAKRICRCTGLATLLALGAAATGCGTVSDFVVDGGGGSVNFNLFAPGGDSGYYDDIYVDDVVYDDYPYDEVYVDDYDDYYWEDGYWYDGYDVIYYDDGYDDYY